MTDKKKGIIINISSLSAHIAVPFLSVYSATKAFVHRFSASMEQEYKSKGITVQCISKLCGNQTDAEFALGTIGLSSQVYGCFAHDLEKTAIDCAGECCINYWVYNSMAKVRAKGLAKKEKKN